jgi:hypothetical protein
VTEFRQLVLAIERRPWCEAPDESSAAAEASCEAPQATAPALTHLRDGPELRRSMVLYGMLQATWQRNRRPSFWELPTSPQDARQHLT